MTDAAPIIQSMAQFSAVLRRAKVDLRTVEELKDALWLATWIDTGEAEDNSDRRDTSGSTELDSPNTVETTAPPEPADEPSVPLELPKPKVDQQSWGDDSETGTSIQIPTAFALRDRLQLARSLRPLRRKVASPGQSVLDEEETVTQTAELDILYPVIQPELERWLEVALVVEESQSTPIWRDTIDEFQMLLGQGVFRDVRTWWIAAGTDGAPTLFASQPSEAPQQRSRSPKELLDASKRRLIIVMSDCRSALWHQGTIHQWLAFWAQNASVSVVQILPNQLWSQTALGKGYPVQLSGAEPGAASSRLDVLGDDHPWMLDEDEDEEPDEDETDANGDATNGASSKAYESLQLPVVTLEPGPLKQWARVTAGAQEAETLGIYFDLSLLSELIRYERERGAASGSENLSPQALVKRFQTTASLTAQKLAGLIAAVPVSPPVVKIIQQEILPESRQVHVAEVFVSGLLRPAADGSALVEYEFLDDNGNDEIRNLLVDEVPIDETASVLDVISRYVAKRIGREVRSFEALLSQQSELSAAERDAVQPFARIAKQTLRRLGGEYKAIAERLDNPEPRERSFSIELEGDFPPLQPFTFRIATVTLVSADGEASGIFLRGRTFDTVTVDASGDEIRLVTETKSARYFVEILAGESIEPAGVYFSYSREDERWAQMIRASLGLLMGLDRVRIVSNDWWPPDTSSTFNLIKGGLESAQIVLVLLSDRSLSSSSCYSEMQQAMQRLDSEIARIIPILIEPVEWRESPVGKLRALPKGGIPLCQWDQPESALSGIVNSVRGSAEYIQMQVAPYLEMVSIPGGTFMMGSHEEEPECSDDERPQHEVTIQSLFMSKYPITQAQWRAVATLPQVNRELKPDPSHFKGDDRPVENVSWFDAQEFCERLSQATGKDYRLPSEAEWEYACRAGTETPFHFGETITTDLANYNGNRTHSNGSEGEYRQETTAVGTFPANAFGLHDMHGNLWEWCLDHWHENYEGAPVDGSPWLTNDENVLRALRGGSWYDVPGFCRSAIRDFNDPAVHDHFVGFRVVCGSARISNSAG